MDFQYNHPYASVTGSAGANTLYGRAGNYLFEMDEDIMSRDHYLSYPTYLEDTYYSVYYVKNATSIR